jgi:hypothetical protein
MIRSTIQRLVALGLVLLPIVLAACGKGGGGAGY